MAQLPPTRVAQRNAICLAQAIAFLWYYRDAVCTHVADLIGKKNEYLKDAGLNNDYYKAMIVTMLEKYPKSTKQEIFSLLEDKLPNVLDKQQKMKKVDNLLQSLSRSGKIKSTGRGSGSG